MIMEVDFVTSDLLEAETLEIDDNSSHNNENCDFEGERCGLCMDIIIDRGVLDCCQHWFCFGCIDNWATITNLCPLCQTEFQMITCVPVYDTIGNNKLDDDSLSRDDDWCIEGKNNSLSFPSYYIDENAVICLDGDGCKIRSGAATMEDDSNLDTSIACDSCDIWYHAFCVGFDTEETSEDTWLCPRCVAGEAPQKSDATSIQRPDSESGPESSFVAEVAFSGKLSVSVADAGETALVVSMVGGNKWTEQVSQSFHPMLEVDNVLEGDTVNSACNIPKAETPFLEKTDVQPVLGTHKHELSLSCDASAADDMKSNGSEGEGTNDVKQESLSEVSLMKDDKMLPLASEEAVDIVGLKRKRTNNSDDALHANDDEANKNEAAVSIKKIKAEGRSEVKIHVFVPDDSQKCNPQIEASKDNTSKKLPQKEQQTIDIMSVVKGTGRRLSKGLAQQNPANKVSKETECVAGLRVKKIMRRVGDDRESTVVVQKLRKEIREAVRNKSPAIEENLFDPKLLAAFRAAIASTPTETVKKLPPSALKAKKAMLQKGKVRENLTKKIYADSNGKRKRAWDRDCEVEFWKHRCMGPTKPEKIATLKSVLGLLRKNPEGSGMEQSHEYEEKNPILSRLYLADTSVFPRKDDVKPLSAITRPSNSQKDKVNFTSIEKVQKPSPDDHSLKFAEPNKMSSKPGVPSVHDNGFKDKVPSMKVKAALSKAQQERNPQGSTVASSGSSKVDSQKATGVQSDDKKIDKRKWALEVLARKNAAAGKNVGHEKNEDIAVLKGNFPLLAQLPIDMRPVLACCRHNKIPTSVRQTQLYRLTEHFLKKANLQEIRRTAETEFAVADAVNIEKAVADKANSKVVYLNLCSQEIMHHSGNKKSEVLKSSSLRTPAVSVDSSKQAGDEVPTDPEVVDALRNAGLLSDSPPGSPEYKMEVVQEVNDSPVQVKDEGPDNVFEMDSIPEADIYGDFEYDLEDEDYIGTTAMQVPKLPLEENESRLKVVFSTLKSESVDDVQDSEEHRRLGNIEDPKDSSSTPKSHINACVIGPTMDSGDDESCARPESVPGEEGEELSLVECEELSLAECEELSLAECEELYGPDKEPLIDKILEEASLKLHGLTNFEATSENEAPGTNESCAASPSKEKKNSSVAQTSSDGKSLNHSKKSEKLLKKYKANKDTDKQRDVANSVSKKVEAYIKEHIRPLCKSGIITTEQYRWAVAKTTDKVMKYHLNAKSANFLIKEGEKVKKLAEQYVEQAQQKEKSDPL